MENEASRGQKRKCKKKYFNKAKKYRSSTRPDSSPRVTLGDSLQGFLITTGGKEFQCLLEAYNILNETADRLYGSFGPTQDATKNEGESGEGGDEDIEACIKREAEQLTSGKLRRFVQVKTHCHNLLFVRSNDPKVEPEAMVSEVFREIEESKRQIARYVERFLPVVGTFKTAQPDKMFEAIEAQLDSVAPREVRSYAVQCRIRNNSSFGGEESLKKRVIEMVHEKRPNWYADLARPQVLVVVNVVHKAACLSLLAEFDKRAKYNLNQFGQRCAKVEESVENGSKKDENSKEVDSNSKGESNLKEETLNSNKCDSNSNGDSNLKVDSNSNGDSNLKVDSNSNGDSNLKEDSLNSNEVDSNLEENDSNSKVDSNLKEDDSNMKDDSNSKIDSNLKEDDLDLKDDSNSQKEDNLFLDSNLQGDLSLTEDK